MRFQILSYNIIPGIFDISGKNKLIFNPTKKKPNRLVFLILFCFFVIFYDNCIIWIDQNTYVKEKEMIRNMLPPFGILKPEPAKDGPPGYWESSR